MNRIAIVSVYDKSGIEFLARSIVQSGRSILSTGQTAAFLREKGIEVLSVEDFTGFPEILSGRVKSLHPKIYAGILARSTPEHANELEKMDIPWIDLVVVNFYPFAAMKEQKISTQELLEYMDVGGPCLLRAAVKGSDRVTVVTDPLDYPQLSQQLQEQKTIDQTTREQLAIKAMESLVLYDSCILQELSKRFEGSALREVHVLREKESLRYGENPHQTAIILQDISMQPDSISQMQVLSGKQMSYNNYLDVQSGNRILQELGDDIPSCCVIKHGIPCGVATGSSIKLAIEKAWQADSVSAFGGVILLNRAPSVSDIAFWEDKFVEIISAPFFAPEVLSALQKQGPNRRLITICPKKENNVLRQNRFLGSLVLQQDLDLPLFADFQVVAGDLESCNQKRELFSFATKISKCLLSNAICIAWEYERGYFMTVGVGGGQSNRIDALSLLAVPRAKSLLELMGSSKSIQDCVVASDGFFPFVDSIEHIYDSGLRFVVQPGGSIQDSAVIQRAQELGLGMVFSHMRHFSH